MKPIYLDHNATTPIDSEVAEAMIPYLKEHFGNPSSSHWYGVQAKQAVERARQQGAELLGCYPDELIFTSGGRVLGVTGLGKDIKSAKDNAYEALGKIKFDGIYYRKDIGDRAIKRGK